MSLEQTSYIPDGFEWETKPSLSTKDSSSVKKEEESVKLKKKKNKRKLVEEPPEIEHSLKAKAFDPTSPSFLDLETLDECERLVLAYPNSSKAWLLYMVFHLKQAEVDKARNVARKALNTICFREEKEKLNIWLAFLNLENLYGTQQTLKDVFKEALNYNDPKKIYNHLVDILIKYQKNEEVEELLSTMIKKFKDDKDVWLRFMSFYMSMGNPEQARKVMEKGLNNLHKKFHADVLFKFAHMEYEQGDMERGKTIFENIIQNYPKRQDIFLHYISLLNRSGKTEEAERLSASLKTR